jgi:hypothetical protein
MCATVPAGRLSEVDGLTLRCGWGRCGWGRELLEGLHDVSTVQVIYQMGRTGTIRGTKVLAHDMAPGEEGLSQGALRVVVAGKGVPGQDVGLRP